VATVGRKAAAEMLYTGEFISAARAEAIGLINRAVPDAELDSELSKLALAIARQSGHALASGKRLLARLRPASAEAYRLAAANMAADMGSQDACAGIDAFISKAPRPAWAHR
jgi:Enoyl-CoA hydratase/carnithine racemase